MLLNKRLFSKFTNLDIVTTVPLVNLGLIIIEVYVGMDIPEKTAVSKIAINVVANFKFSVLFFVIR